EKCVTAKEDKHGQTEMKIPDFIKELSLHDNNPEDEEPDNDKKEENGNKKGENKKEEVNKKKEVAIEEERNIYEVENLSKTIEFEPKQDIHILSPQADDDVYLDYDQMYDTSPGEFLHEEIERNEE
ncbi:unnamed protein product, partial [Brenthis ino]